MLRSMFPRPMDEWGILLRRNAVAFGYDDNWLLRAVRAGLLVRIRQGAYVDAQVWRHADPAKRHLLKARAVMQQYDDRVALSHTSAHLLRGGPDWGLRLDRVHVTNLFAHGDRTKAGIVHHRGTAGVNDITIAEEHWITTPGRAAVETAALAPLVPAVCVLDWALHEKLTTRDELEMYARAYMREWPGTVGLPQAVDLCDGRSESIGEGRLRLALVGQGIRTEPQWKVFHPSGRLAGRVDFLLPDLHEMVEFDGEIKYGRLLKPGQSIDDVIRAERAREVLLEELTGLRMVRVTWRELDDEGSLAARIRRIASQRRAA